MTDTATDIATRSPSRHRRLASTAAGGAMVAEYWERIFTARERGGHIVWYNGVALNPIFEAAGLDWCHGEAYAARLAAQHLEVPAQLAGAEYGYDHELCSYARTHLGCAVLTKQKQQLGIPSLVADDDARELAAMLPAPDFIVNGYAGCSTGQQWDAMTYRVFDRQLPLFNVAIPMMWGNGADAGYLRGEEFEQAAVHVADQLRELIAYLEAQTGRPFDWDALTEGMTYIKRASELRLEAMQLCAAAPTPATFWDWVAAIAPINFLPANQDLVDFFAGMKAEIAQRIRDGVAGVEHERYRFYFDGIMNWNKLGWLSRKFAEYDVAVVAGRYTHDSFWQEPDLIDPRDPLLGMAKNYLICPINHGMKQMRELLLKRVDEYRIDGIAFHSTRTCRVMTNPQALLARIAEEERGVKSFVFEGDVADASFYRDDLLETRLVATLEAIDVQRARAGR